MSTCWYRPFRPKVDISSNLEPFSCFTSATLSRKAVVDCPAVSVPFSLLLDEGERSPCLETKTQLAMRKKNPLKKSRPESAISAQMFLSVHRLTLQVRVREPQSKMSTCKPKRIHLQGGNSWLLFSAFPPILPLWTQAPQKGWALYR